MADDIMLATQSSHSKMRIAPINQHNYGRVV